MKTKTPLSLKDKCLLLARNYDVVYGTAGNYNGESMGN